MNILKNIETLSHMYYCLMIDYHKDRDCHFIIEECREVEKFSYGKDTYANFCYYIVKHNGYVNDSFEQCFDNLYEAEQFLYQKLKEYVKKEIDHWLSIDENNHMDECQLKTAKESYPMLIKFKEKLKCL